MLTLYLQKVLQHCDFILKSRSLCQVTVSPVKHTSNEGYRKSYIADKIRVYVRGGSGGQGSQIAGGIGGKGGSVLIKCLKGASLAPYTLRQNRRIIAQHGNHYKRGQFKAKPGNDVYISVPPGTEIRSAQNELFVDLNKHGEVIKIANGGAGGSARTKDFNGVKGERKNIILELKTIADVSLTGFPNAGKSSLLRVLSRARPKVGNYPFTTISPMVGSIFYSDSRQITVADLPGLIEDAHLNKGMGHKFLRHVERTKVIVLVVDVNGFQLKTNNRSPFETVILLLKELALYNESLLSRPFFLVVNKMDCENADNRYSELLKEIKMADENHKLIQECVYGEEILHHLHNFHRNNSENILLVSTVTGEGISVLQDKLYQNVPHDPLDVSLENA